MTPEERAFDVVRRWENGKPWQLSDIIDAIRAAVAEERERCANLTPLLPVPDPRGSTWAAQEHAIAIYRGAIRSGTTAGGGE